MDYVWTPWRYKYIAEGVKDDGCVFCDAPALGDDAKALIVLRAAKNYIILNRFPYTSGHVLVVPYVHERTLSAVDGSTLEEMILLAQRTERALDSIYHPEGFNIGMNVGRAAGAGIAGHLHLHVLPRWLGDTNFMTTVAETRLEPEELGDTYRKLRAALAAGNGTPPSEK